MKKPPLEPPITVTLSEASRLLGVSRSRFYQWQTTGMISVYRYNGNRPLYLRAEVVALLDRLPRGSKSVGPLLPPEDRALAKERAGEPDFNSLLTECFERLVPSLGEDEARARAIADVTRLYRRHHKCDLKPARAAVLALVPAEQQRASEGEPPPNDLQQPDLGPEPEPLAPADPEPPEPNFRRLYFDHLNPGAGEEGKLRAFEFVVNAYRRFHNCSLEEAERAVTAAIKRGGLL